MVESLHLRKLHSMWRTLMQQSIAVHIHSQLSGLLSRFKSVTVNSQVSTGGESFHGNPAITCTLFAISSLHLEGIFVGGAVVQA